MRNAGERTWVRLGVGVGLWFGLGLGLGLGFEFGLGVWGRSRGRVEDLDGDVADDASDDGGGGVAEGGHLVRLGGAQSAQSRLEVAGTYVLPWISHGAVVLLPRPRYGPPSSVSVSVSQRATE